MYYIFPTEIWGIGFLTNPLQYPVFSPPTTLGTSKPLCLLFHFDMVNVAPDSINEQFYSFFMSNSYCIYYNSGNLKNNVPPMGAPKSDQNKSPTNPQCIPQVGNGEWDLRTMIGRPSALQHRLYIYLKIQWRGGIYNL